VGSEIVRQALEIHQKKSGSFRRRSLKPRKELIAKFGATARVKFSSDTQ
jgi:hypothetical protein